MAELDEVDQAKDAEGAAALESRLGEEQPEEGEPRLEGAPDERVRPRLPGWAVALILGLLVIAVITSVLAANATAARRRQEADRIAVADTAGRLATALSTYDYRSFDATKKRVLALSTGSFSAEYEKAVGALASLIAETKATSEATVSDVFVSEIDGGKAKSIVVVEIRGSGVSGPRVSVDNYVELSLVKVEGVWKVDGVSNLNLGVASSPGSGTTPPSTAPPAPTTTATVG